MMPSPYLAREALIMEMAQHLRGFQRPEDVKRMLLVAGYTSQQIEAHGVEAAKRELLRRALQTARAA